MTTTSTGTLPEHANPSTTHSAAAGAATTARRRGRPQSAADTAAERGLFAVAGDAPTERAWTDADVCAYLGISARKLTELLGEGDFPEPRRLGGRSQGRRWAPEAIPAWVAAPERNRLERAGRIGAKGTAVRL